MQKNTNFILRMMNRMEKLKKNWVITINDGQEIKYNRISSYTGTYQIIFGILSELK